MTEPLSSEKETAPTEKKPSAPTSRLGLFFSILLILVALGVMLRGALPSLLVHDEEKTISAAVSPVPALAERAEKPLEKSLEGPQAPAPTATIGGAEDIEKLKASLAGLSGALTLLQGELEKSAQKTNEVGAKATLGLAVALAFMQMENAALAGRAFEGERQTLRRIAGENPALIEKLMGLEGEALAGVPTLEAVRRDWQALASEAQAALRRTAAKTWQERLLVALEGLISIRPLAPSAQESLSFAAIELDLTRGDLGGALAKVAALPPEVRQTLEPWRMKAEKRKALEDKMNDLANDLIGQGEAAAAPPAPQAPQGEVAP